MDHRRCSIGVGMVDLYDHSHSDCFTIDDYKFYLDSVIHICEFADTEEKERVKYECSNPWIHNRIFHRGMFGVMMLELLIASRDDRED